MENTKVNFKYSFGTPHRLCISLPQASKKCLLDSTPDGVTVLWSDDDLTKIAPGAFYGPKIQWIFDINVEIDSKLVQGVLWKRVENRLPALEYIWDYDGVTIRLIAVSSYDEDIFKFEIENKSSDKKEVGIIGKTKDLSFNTKWMNKESKYNMLLAHYGDRSDRILFFSTAETEKLKSCSNIDVFRKIKSQESYSFFFIRPHRKIVDDIERLLKINWDHKLKTALEIWRKIIDKAQKFIIPDKMIEDAYYACFCDIFVAQEINSEGFLAGLAGTDLYRCMNTCEPTIAAQVMDHSGLFLESEHLMRGILYPQEENGRWDDFRRWGHDIWWIPAPRCNWLKEHYLFTKNKKLLLFGFEKMYKHIKWAHQQRQKTKVLNELGEKPLTWGLMPRGMGDGGLMDDDDYFGYFIPSNVYHCFLIKIAIWAAKELNLDNEVNELQEYYDDAFECTMEAIRKGAIQEKDGYKWIPGVPGKTSGSRWAATASIYPCELIDPFDELATGTIKKLESNKSEGGLPLDTGWLKGGIWAAIAIDNLAYAHLARGEYDKASDYLYPVINHGSPLFTWCEERMPEPNSKVITGDLQHTWTPHIVNKFIRDIIIREKENKLYLLSAIPRFWLSDGFEVGVNNSFTHFGKVDFTIKREGNILNFDFNIENINNLEKLLLFIRLPENYNELKIIENKENVSFLLKRDLIEISNVKSSFSIKINFL